MVTAKDIAAPGAPHSRHDTPISDGALSETSNLTSSEIAADGDLVLHVEHETRVAKSAHSFRVRSSSLENNSSYFRNLLQPGKFAEAARIEAEREKLRARYRDFADIPFAELPVVEIQDLGRISAIKSVEALMGDFLLILHGRETQSSPPLANLANLAVVADRFDALSIVKSYTQRKRLIRLIDAKVTPKIDNALSEEKVRQRLLAGLLLDFPPWVERYSARVIIKGWVGKEAEHTAALWWDLPLQVEEELLFRRDCILQTIQSLPTFFLGLYLSRERQCKLGYDSSPQCDSFQLGEMIRFFSRVDVLRLQGTLLDTEEPASPYAGDIQALLDVLRQVPEYQIDKHHAHCGIRTRIVPLLSLLEEALQHIGVCLECWSRDRRKHAWADSHRPLIWKRGAIRTKSPDHDSKHSDIRSLFMANERDWAV